MEDKQMPFSGKDLQKMIVPLFLEQLLVMLVGIAAAMVCDRVIRAVILSGVGNRGNGKSFRLYDISIKKQPLKFEFP